MAKVKKKRNKQYHGEDASTPVQKTVHHYTAVVRSPFGEWWFNNKRRVRLVAIITVLVVFGGWLAIEAVRTIFFH